MPNWNVYKVFANGKRAKSPYTTFDADDGQHFFETILPTLNEKLQKYIENKKKERNAIQAQIQDDSFAISVYSDTLMATFLKRKLVLFYRVPLYFFAMSNSFWVLH